MNEHHSLAFKFAGDEGKIIIFKGTNNINVTGITMIMAIITETN